MESNTKQAAETVFKPDSEGAQAVQQAALTNNGVSTVKALMNDAGAVAENILSDVTNFSSDLKAANQALIDGLRSPNSSTIVKINNTIASVSNYARALVGNAANPILNSILPGSAPSGGDTSLGGIFGNAINDVTDAGNTLSAAFDAAKNITNNLSGGLNNLSQTLVGNTADVAGNVADAGIAANTNLLNSSSKTGNSILDGVSNIGKSMLNTASTVANNLVDGVKNVSSQLLGEGKLLDQVSDSVKNTVESAGKLAGDLVDNTAKLAGGMVDSVSDMAKSLVDGAGKLAEGAVNAATNAVKGVTDALGNVFGDADKAAADATKALDTKKATDKINEAKRPEEGKPAPDEKKAQSYDWLDDPAMDPLYVSSEFKSPTTEGGDSATTPTTNGGKTNDSSKTEQEKKSELDWHSVEAKLPRGLALMMHDGDQQFLNPYGPEDSYWTMYSFRPMDAK